jgi:SAM-dependent methyltransferase
MHLIHRNTCRICGSHCLTKVVDLGDQHLQGSFIKPGKEAPPARRIPLQLVRCDCTRDERACGLLQLAHSTPTQILYAAYWYRSGTNRTMRDHLQSIADDAASMIQKPDACVLDIGCNDGTLLNAFPKSFSKFGIDPSDVAREATADATIIRDLFPSEQLRMASSGMKFDAVTSIAMFYDLESPGAFVDAVKQVLAPDGLWIFEQSYMPRMLEMNSYDTICHEHLEYYSLAVVEDLLGRHDMQVVRVTENAINGGSFRCYATHADNFTYKRPQHDAALAALRQYEFDLELDTDRPYRNFQERVNTHRDDLRSLLKRLRQEGKRIHVYGASTKGNVILQFCGIDNAVVECAADRNADKHGAQTIGTDIPIVSEAESRARRPDYYLVLPWHFREEFLERERETLRAGTAMIFPLPTIDVVRFGD